MHINERSGSRWVNSNAEQVLVRLYVKFRRRYKGNPDSNQMCCMWSTLNPPDNIYNTEQILALEKSFGIEFTEDEVYELYDMTIQEAADIINIMIKNASNQIQFDPTWAACL